MTKDVRLGGLLPGIGFLLLGLVLPQFINVGSFRIYDILNTAAIQRDFGLLLSAAYLLVIMNSLRALPIYLGSYLFCSAIFKKNRWLFRAMVIVIIITMYFLTSALYAVRYDFGIPSLLVIFIIYMLNGFNLETVRVYKRSAVLICALVGVQFLDVIPALTHYGFGRGVVSSDIKLLAQFFDNHNILTLFAFSQMAVFLSMATLLSRLLADQHRLVLSTQALLEARMQALETKKDTEIRHLVHDLKTPLTTIEALSGVALMLSDDEKIREYQRRIVDSADAMSEMISEILSTDHLRPVSTQALFDYSLSQVTSQRDKDRITLHNAVPSRFININKVTFSRALINLITNAINAIDPDTGKIAITVVSVGGNVVITIADNGCGIAPYNLAQVWEIGYSSHGSTGLGMSYVRDIVNGCGGSITIDSAEGKGTVATIYIREVKPDEPKTDNRIGG